MNPSLGPFRIVFPVLLLFLLVPVSAEGEDYWRSTRVAPHGPINALVIDGPGRVYAGSDSGWVHISTDVGITWRSVEATSRSIRWLLNDPSGWLVGALDSGLVRSFDQGVTWTPAGLKDQGMVSVAGDAAGWLYAGTSTGIFSSSDVGTSWNALPAIPGVLSSIAATPGAVFAATDSGVFRCSDAQHWTRVTPGPRVWQIGTAGPGILLAISTSDTGNVLFGSTNSGASWAAMLSIKYGSLSMPVRGAGQSLVSLLIHREQGGSWIDFISSADLGTTWGDTVTRYDYIPTLVALHPSGRMFMLVTQPGGG